MRADGRGTAVDAAAMQRAAGDGRLRRVRRGSYVAADAWRDLDDRARHLVRVRAVAAAALAPPVLSHRSAAAVLALPVIGHLGDRVHVVQGPAGGGRSEGDVVRHTVAGRLDVVELDGVLVTSAARTVTDLARSEGLLAGVVAGDAALRAGLTTLDALRAEVLQVGSGRGVRAARRAVDLVDPRTESPGESLSRVRLAEAGLPAPDLQRELYDAAGLIGRVDFWWQDAGVVGEFDGRVKYGTGDPDVLWDEKLREDRLRAAGHRVVRWTWADAWAGAPMTTRLRAAGVR